MNDHWMQTYSGRQYFYGEADIPNDINILDIAKSLSRQSRFYGHTTAPLSVAEHSVVCAEIAREEGGTARQQLYALMHDAHEAFTGDIVRPFKGYLMERCGVQVRGIETEIQRDIYRGLAIPQPEPVDLHLVERVDIMALAAERQLFMAGPHHWHVDNIAVPAYVLGSYGNWEPDEACRYFEKAFERLMSAADFESRVPLE